MRTGVQDHTSYDIKTIHTHATGLERVRQGLQQARTSEQAVKCVASHIT